MLAGGGKHGLKMFTNRVPFQVCEVISEYDQQAQVGAIMMECYQLHTRALMWEQLIVKYRIPDVLARVIHSYIVDNKFETFPPRHHASKTFLAEIAIQANQQVKKGEMHTLFIETDDDDGIWVNRDKSSIILETEGDYVSMRGTLVLEFQPTVCNGSCLYITIPFDPNDHAIGKCTVQTLHGEKMKGACVLKYERHKWYHYEPRLEFCKRQWNDEQYTPTDFITNTEDLDFGGMTDCIVKFEIEFYQ